MVFKCKVLTKLSIFFREIKLSIWLSDEYKIT